MHTTPHLTLMFRRFRNRSVEVRKYISEANGGKDKIGRGGREMKRFFTITVELKKNKQTETTL